MRFFRCWMASPKAAMERTLAIAMRHAAEPAMREPKLFFGSLLDSNLQLSTVFSHFV
ncbi:MAG: hypothetical protein ACJARK_000911 [Marinobacter psychrophilus]|jgi:hypothetical protein|nr:hypothetical protein MRBBS_0151 [Marinobacter sp. BSs20148]